MRTEAISKDRPNGAWTAPVDLSRMQQQLVDLTKEAYTKIVDRAALSLKEVNRRSSIFVREYPVQVTAGALGLGFLFGMLIRRRG